MAHRITRTIVAAHWNGPMADGSLVIEKNGTKLAPQVDKDAIWTRDGNLDL